MTPPDEYRQAFEKALSDLETGVKKRDLLNAEIAGLRETVRVLASRISLPVTEQQRVAQVLAMVDYASPNLRDSIKRLLARVHPEALTAIEVRNALEEIGFNFDDFSNSLSACHATLKRMLADEEVEPGKEKNGKPTYKQVLRAKIGLPTLYEGLPGINVRTLADLAGQSTDFIEGHPLRGIGRRPKSLGERIADARKK